MTPETTGCVPSGPPGHRLACARGTGAPGLRASLSPISVQPRVPVRAPVPEPFPDTPLLTCRSRVTGLVGVGGVGVTIRTLVGAVVLTVAERLVTDGVTGGWAEVVAAVAI